ncbi:MULTISPECIES: DNA repair protein RecN [unclassified Corynebacterium]|uniref:DNA repair protein RecN n=1 Tax=unclassified Corynebacterium TaxID=2624378 RepID=UPI00264CD3AD|nr:MULTISPECIES: DNA repair protein RecN [unclassified Corynebacterium]MDN8594676.1 DNA repair protein RecN [Corynebacterium sp. P4_F2]WKK56119.1 DNA repair protein RecN [Corynebacterium sp. P4-C1]WKK63531.1 DNA repair protein RecN [Corynebacterium sp. P8-C1]
MLVEISIDNLGVIPHSHVEFAPGLNVLTGETGAGKTMVVTGLRLLTGGRADASKVRTGAQQAGVEGAFNADSLDDVARAAVTELLDEAGAAADENGEYLVARTVKSTGRSRAHLGGRTVPAATLSRFTGELLAIHGQNDQLRLLSPAEQLAALDSYDPKIAPLKEHYREAYTHWRKVSKDLEERVNKRRELAQEVDRLTFAVAEIDEVAPEVGEDTELVASVNRLQDVDALREAAQEAIVSIDGAGAIGEFAAEEDTASDLVGRAASALSGSSDEQLRALGGQLNDVASVLSDVSGELGMYLSELPSDPEELERLLQRQQELKNLTRKYAPDIAGVLKWRDRAQARLESIDTSAEALEKLKKEVATANKAMVSRAAKLTKARTAAAGKLAEAVTGELRGLAMPKARLTVDVGKQDYDRDGADAVELRLAPNDALEPQPLASSASGGELSRVMLALEVILSARRGGASLVFDEVDAGVGGRAAVEIGRRLARLALNNQVIVVTHLPQVAAYADNHLHVSKNVGDETVTSGVRELSGEERVDELARMLAGMDDSASGRAHAAELLDKARADVEAFRA